MQSVKTTVSIKRRVRRVVFAHDTCGSSVWELYVWIYFQIWVFFSTLCSSASHQNLISKKPLLCFVFQTFFLVEITFSVIVPFSEVHLRILFPLFAVLEEHGAAPWTHTNIKLGATFVCLDAVSLFLHCRESTVPSVIHYCWRRRDGLGSGGRVLL